MQRRPGWFQCFYAESHSDTQLAVRMVRSSESHWRTFAGHPPFPRWHSGPGVSLWGTTWIEELRLCCCSGQKLESCQAGWGKYTCTGGLEKWSTGVVSVIKAYLSQLSVFLPLSWSSGAWHMSCNACMTSIIVFKIWKINSKTSSWTSWIALREGHLASQWCKPLVWSPDLAEPHRPKESLDRNWSFLPLGEGLNGRKLWYVIIRNTNAKKSNQWIMQY